MCWLELGDKQFVGTDILQVTTDMVIEARDHL